MKANGFNGGMGGSMHAFFTPFGAYPNNAIVGASSGIATGAALRKKLNGSRSIAVALSGDGSTGCGPVFEAMNFASMAQYDTLWTDAQKGRRARSLASTTISMRWVGRPSVRPWAGTGCRASEPASIRTPCTRKPSMEQPVGGCRCGCAQA